VRSAIGAGVKVISIPGPTAFVAALILSGLPVHGFTFRGFPPRKSAARRRFLQVDLNSPHTLIFYESPYRLKAFLADATYVYGDRQAALANDLTKVYERVQRGTLSELLCSFNGSEPKGEYTIVIAGAGDKKRASGQAASSIESGDESS
jgi:16S rRNA (cytidine1402-2'-O)-methyltransferase